MIFPIRKPREDMPCLNHRLLLGGYLDDIELFFRFNGVFFAELKVDCFGEGFGAGGLKFEIQVHHLARSRAQISSLLFRRLSFLS